MPSYFPSDILATSQLPDGIIWSRTAKVIVLLELSVSWEEVMVQAHTYKTERYDQLEASLTAAGWRVHRFAFEVGSRGYLSSTTSTMLRAFGLSRRETKTIRDVLSTTSLLCSYVFYRASRCMDWAIPVLLRISDAESLSIPDVDDPQYVRLTSGQAEQQPNDSADPTRSGADEHRPATPPPDDASHHISAD